MKSRTKELPSTNVNAQRCMQAMATFPGSDEALAKRWGYTNSGIYNIRKRYRDTKTVAMSVISAYLLDDGISPEFRERGTGSAWLPTVRPVAAHCVRRTKRGNLETRLAALEMAQSQRLAALEEAQANNAKNIADLIEALSSAANCQKNDDYLSPRGPMAATGYAGLATG